MTLDTRIARSLSAGVVNSGPGARAARGIFRKEGEYWTVGYNGKDSRLKDSKGLGYLAHLLRHPGVEFHVLDLFGGIAGRRDDDDAHTSTHDLPRRDEDLANAGMHITGLGDAGEMLDDQAKASYRRRLSELGEELAEAKELGNIERAEAAEAEIDALTRELSRAVGLGGRNRKAASASERARQSITKTIKAVVERIARSDSPLGDLFARCIKTGTFCSYQPDLDFPLAWEFAGTTLDPLEPPTSDGDPDSAHAEHLQAPAAMLEVAQFSLAERTAFAGREVEREALQAILDRAQKGRGAVVMLGGGPGVGKTRLAMEMAEYASRNGFRSFVGHCYEREEPFPYLPFAEIIESGLAHSSSFETFRREMGENATALAQVAPSLRRIFPDIPEPLDLPAQQRRRQLFQSLAEAAARSAQVRPLLFILDDLQWADESTLALLIHFANRVSQFSLVIIGTYRDDYAQNNPALVRSLEELIRQGVRPLKLGGLPKESLAQMLRGLSNGEPPEILVNVIFEESQGNPFFVEEVYRHLVEEGKVFDAAGQFRTDIQVDEVDVPENVRLIVNRRLERLDENERQALVAAAVIGRCFSFKLLAAISQTDIDELFAAVEKAQRMGIIVASSEGPEKPFAFVHELVRQTLLAGISMPRKQRLHASVAEAIERLDPDVNGCAGEIADHLLKAGSFADGQLLVRWLARAGKAALDASAFDEARRSFRSALFRQSAADQAERAQLLASLALAELGLEHWDAALANRGEVLEIYTKLDDREMIGRGFTDLADAFIWAGRFPDATEIARRGLGYLERDVSANRARLLAALGQALAAAANLEPASQALQEALTIASKLAAPQLEARVLGARSIVNLHFFRLREAANDGFRSEQLGGSEAPPWQRALQLRVLHQALLYLGRVREAMEIADELEPLAMKIGQAYSVALCRSTRLWTAFREKPDLEKLATGLQQLSRTDQKARFAFWDVLSEVQLSLVDYIRGNSSGALSHAEASCRPQPGSSIQGFGEGMLFRQLAYAGDRDGALAVIDKRRKWLPTSGQPNARGSWWMLALVVEGLVMLGERSEAGQLYPLVRELLATGAVVLWPIARFAQTIAGLAAAAAGQADAAEEHFKIALQQAESFPDLLEQAEIKRFHAMLLMERAASGDREKARKLLDQALARYADIGMPRHSEMAQTLVKRLSSTRVARERH
jgi:eukaryotic-like serine/threonine-protein kinase